MMKKVTMLTVLFFIASFANVALGAAFGAYSDTQKAKKNGISFLYKTPSGDTVWVTEVSSPDRDPEKFKEDFCKIFPDCIYMGEVTEFVKKMP